jgi:hypothetical protein
MNNAGTWFLKGAWIEMGIEHALVEVIEDACRSYQVKVPASPMRVLTHAREVLVRKNETLAFMPLFENMTRLEHLDTYDDAGLGWLIESSQVNRTDTMRHYLSELTILEIATPAWQALARCYWRAWYQAGSIPDSHVFYVDMHDKVIWTETPSPVGFVSALHEVRACLKQAFVHGRGGHALFCCTYMADIHLSEVVVEVAHLFEQAIGAEIVQVIVTDREGLAVGVIQDLAGQNKAFVALLKANQYSGEADFVRQGRFRQLKDYRTGQVTHRVADADFELAPGLMVRAALIYDLDHPDVLIALITTVRRETEPDICRIVRWYLARWNTQENSFRAQIAFVHLNVNFGLHGKHSVPDRRIARQIAELATHLQAVTRKLESKLAQLVELESQLQNVTESHERKVVDLLRPPRRQGPQAASRAAKRQQRLREHQQRYQQRLSKLLTSRAKLEQAIEAHRQEQARVADELIRLDPQAKFFEVDTEKDQMMAALRIGLHNSALWARDHYFSSAYRHTTPLTLWRTFFNQDGFYLETTDCIIITLNPFSTPRLQQEVSKACNRFNQRKIVTLSGKQIEIRVANCI